jgi:fructokinase
MSHRIGIDLGGSKIEAVLIAPDERIVLRNRIPTPRNREYTAIVDAVCAMIDDAARHVPNGQPCTLGLGIPGSINPATGLVHNANTTCLIGKPLQQDLERTLRRAIGIENDANCFTLAECRQGAGRGYGLVFGIIMGTGCGGGIYCNGSIIKGRNAIAGEWGHISVDPNGAECYCGKRGCVETTISGGGVEKNSLNATAVR